MHLSFMAFAFGILAFGQVASAEQLAGTVTGGGGPIAQSTVTLWAAGEGIPTKLSETSTGEDGAFRVQVDTQAAGGGVLYLPNRPCMAALAARSPNSPRMAARSHR